MRIVMNLIATKIEWRGKTAEINMEAQYIKATMHGDPKKT